jgi:hypothetical protein
MLSAAARHQPTTHGARPQSLISPFTTVGCYLSPLDFRMVRWPVGVSFGLDGHHNLWQRLAGGKSMALDPAAPSSSLQLQPLPEIQPLPRAANSRQRPINRRQRLCRWSRSAQASRRIFSRPRLFASHPSSRLSAQPVPRAHGGPSAKKVVVNGGVG